MPYVVLGYDESRSEPLDIAELNKLVNEGTVMPTQIVTDLQSGRMMPLSAVEGVVITKREPLVGEVPPQITGYPRPTLVTPQTTNLAPLAYMAIVFLTVGLIATVAGQRQFGAEFCGVIMFLAAALICQPAKRGAPRLARWVQALSLLAFIAMVAHLWRAIAYVST